MKRIIIASFRLGLAAVIVLLYPQQFSPGGDLKRPHAILTLSVICAPTDAEAERLASSLLVAFARLRTGQTSLLLPPEQALTSPATFLIAPGETYDFQVRPERDGNMELTLDLLLLKEKVTQAIQVDSGALP